MSRRRKVGHLVIMGVAAALAATGCAEAQGTRPPPSTAPVERPVHATTPADRPGDPTPSATVTATESATPRPSAPARQTRTSSAPPTAPTEPPTTSPPRPRSLRSCRSADLSASVGEYGAEMSQPFLTVKLTNTSRSACRVHGYVALQVFGTYQGQPLAPGDVAVRHGSTYERPDPGAHWVTVAPGHVASFSLGTATAYPGHQVTLHRFAFSITVDGDTLSVGHAMAASAPVGEPVPVKETALQAGMPSG